MAKQNCFILLDRSGSMDSHWKETIGSINAFVEKLEIDGNVVLASFDSQSYDIVRNSSPKNWKPLTTTEITPRAGTPLLDASGRLFWTALDSGSEKAVIVVMTDGHENQSKLFNKYNITEITKEIEKRGYELIFLGANFDKINENVSFYRDSATAYSSARSLNMTTANFSGTMRSLAEKSSQYFTSGKAVEFNEEEKKDAVK